MESLCKTDEDIIVQDSALISLASLACLHVIFLFQYQHRAPSHDSRILSCVHVFALQCRVLPKESMQPADLIAIGH